MKKGKKYNESSKLVDRATVYEPADALALACQTAKAKFDETIEIHVRLGVDSRHADQQVRGAVVLPNGTGKKVRVLAFCKGEDKVNAAKEAGADYVGAEEYAEKIQKENWFDFDEYRLDKTNIIHCVIGKASFGAEKLGENFNALMGAIIKAKPAAAKGQYIRSCVLASTMGPGIKVSTSKLG